MDIPSPFDGGGCGWGWTRQRPFGPPSPSSPPAEGRGDFLGLCLFNYGLLSNYSKAVREDQRRLCLFWGVSLMLIFHP